MKPTKVNILGIPYKIEYVDRPISQDQDSTTVGNINYTDKIITIYDKNKSLEDIWATLLHEILHGICESAGLRLNDKDMHKELDVLAITLMDVLFRNDWIKKDETSN